MSGAGSFKHGHAVNGRLTHEYNCWAMMKQRCLNPKATAYRHYGARGIGVCDRWRAFAAFIADVGSAPSPRHSLDRINNDGDYEPGNVRWATKSEQAKNQRPGLRPNKLTATAAAEIRALRAQGCFVRIIAERFNVNTSTVRDIVARRTWKAA